MNIKWVWLHSKKKIQKQGIFSAGSLGKLLLLTLALLNGYAEFLRQLSLHWFYGLLNWSGCLVRWPHFLQWLYKHLSENPILPQKEYIFWDRICCDQGETFWESLPSKKHSVTFCLTIIWFWKHNICTSSFIQILILHHLQDLLPEICTWFTLNLEII